MKTGKASKTAELAAAIRARHYLNDQAHIFSDPLAVHFLRPSYRLICKSGILDWLVFKKIYGDLLPFHSLVLIRSRFVEDTLSAMIEQGCNQYVILGAGLDSLSFRQTERHKTIKIVEIDHPDTQKAKLKRLERIGFRPPTNTEFVSIDFETSHLKDALARCSYNAEKTTLFSWLGTTYYLTRDAVIDTLKTIANNSVAGSEVLFDYTAELEPQPHEIRENRQTVKAGKHLMKITEKSAEPLLTAITPKELEQEASALGYEVVENLGPDCMQKRYLNQHKDMLPPTPYGHIARLRLT